jgi:hypothetical protein
MLPEVDSPLPAVWEGKDLRTHRSASVSSFNDPLEYVRDVYNFGLCPCQWPQFADPREGFPRGSDEESDRDETISFSVSKNNDHF